MQDALSTMHKISSELDGGFGTNIIQTLPKLIFKKKNLKKH